MIEGSTRGSHASTRGGDRAPEIRDPGLRHAELHGPSTAGATRAVRAAYPGRRSHPLPGTAAAAPSATDGDRA
jgi:hypothetical protein